MAGAGFKTFNTGDVLTASDVNTYLMQQTTMVFADASARSTALGANVAEGMISYLKDTNAVEVYNGSNWVSSDDPNAIQNTIVDAKGDIITATAADTPARLAVGANGYTLVADSSTSTGLAYAGTTNGNPVLNSAFQIWQRGTSISLAASTTAANGYNADRWDTVTGANQACTISRQTTSDTTNLPNIQYCLRYQRNSGQTGTGNLSLSQSFESINSIPYAGRTITFSFYARRGANYSATSNLLYVYIVGGTGTDQNLENGFTGQTNIVDSTATLTTTWQRFTFTGTVGSTITQIAPRFIFPPTGTAGANDYYEVTGVQIDLGSTALPFRTYANTIQEELAACQRYYYRINSSGNVYSALSGWGNASSTTQANPTVAFPVQMRSAPSSLDYANIGVHDIVGGVIATTSCVLGYNSQSQAIVYALVSSGLTQYRTYYLLSNNSTAAYIGFSAEL